MTNYKQLCAELVRIADALDSGKPLAANQGQALDGYVALAAFRDVANRVRATLAEDEPEEPMDEEILDLAAKGIEPYDSCGISVGEYELETECAIELYGSELCNFARAVLARWGNHPAKPDTSLQPIPASERMPELVPLSERPWEREEWCDEQGRCWWFDSADPGWVFDTPKTCRHWSSFVLPAHALPLPTHD